MRSLTVFNKKDNKDRILSNIKFDNAQDINNIITVPSVFKLDYNKGIKCYCFDLYITE